ncbi:PorP/SprF family type IX secretion system membrane protein [Flavivirga jejuensis]|uniref:Type IX secretion system membrane protein PorP/SprF n=1 Tax=Flavivirga jejuensis TaxID=870487 RepID=A0ABT8WMK6_9FLAO|nr:type IX secretion system membrane protein PorP/SprF [Flavivirga jejuensis]MDO5974389.1 type IX secretion system membrane protein PorP/SprF [Flavivirga jejuensis]
MKIKIFIVFIICGLSVFAQQEPQYTQYMYNMSLVNPGYMINEPSIVQVGSLYRTQWVGIEGAPKTANAFANIPLSEKVELSVNYLNDNVGGNVNLSENVFNVNAAYKINLQKDLNLSFGIKMGFDHINFSALGSNVGGDPLFQNTNKTVINIGAGVFLFHKNYYVGLSSPNLIPSDLDVNSDVVYKDKPHAFLIGGYVFDINSEFKLKPSAVVKYVTGSPLSFDISTNVLYQNTFELGISYRYQDAVAGLAGINITPNLKVGYAYDFNTNKLNTYNNGSHEFILLYRFDVLGLSKKYSSPRFY